MAFYDNNRKVANTVGFLPASPPNTAGFLPLLIQWASFPHPLLIQWASFLHPHLIQWAFFPFLIQWVSFPHPLLIQWVSFPHPLLVQWASFQQPLPITVVTSLIIYLTLYYDVVFICDPVGFISLVSRNPGTLTGATALKTASPHCTSSVSYNKSSRPSEPRPFLWVGADVLNLVYVLSGHKNYCEVKSTRAVSCLQVSTPPDNASMFLKTRLVANSQPSCLSFLSVLMFHLYTSRSCMLWDLTWVLLG